ncbi:hypothetical protein KDL29_04100 [bacterium]|nr:hypothetical protein [bacterium]
MREMLQSGIDDAPQDAPEPEVIVVREPVVIDGGGRQYSHRERASSCYINRSCPTCAPCCLAMFLAPMIFLLWTLYPGWKQSREIARYSSRDASQQAESQPDPASDRLLSEVRELEFDSRTAVEAFIEERGIAYSRREDGYWIASDRTQQAALVVLQQRWMELPEDPYGDEEVPEAAADE